MKSLKLRGLVPSIGLVIVAFAWHFALVVCESKNSESPIAANFATQRYRLDSSQSKFVAHALRGGLLWFKGHDHLVAARDVSGEAEITTDAINPASLLLVVKSDSMAETNTGLTDQQKQIIDKELGEIVLLTSLYPD